MKKVTISISLVDTYDQDFTISNEILIRKNKLEINKTFFTGINSSINDINEAYKIQKELIVIINTMFDNSKFDFFKKGEDDEN